jgi:predicted NBD/HSP70 family sugar kinase
MHAKVLSVYIKFTEIIISKYSTRETMRYAIGIDLGGTKIEGALVDEKGRVLKRFRVMTEASKGRQTVLKNILKVIDSLISKNIAGVGVGIPGRAQRGRITFMPNIKALEGFQLTGFLEKTTGKRVILQNDSECFALAEHMFGAGRKAQNMIGVIIGTGIGSGIIINGRIYSGSRGYAGEIGHIILERGDVESYSSGKSIARRYTELGGRVARPDPAKIYASKERVAGKVIEEALDTLAKTIAALATALDLNIAVLGGGISNLPIYDKLNRKVDGYLYCPLKGKVKVVKNKLGDSAGVIGAAALAF